MAAAAAAAGTGTAVLVDAALAPYEYEHPGLRWLVRQHVLAVLREFPALSPSVDTYTSDGGDSAVLLSARGLLAVSPALPPVLLTLWLPRDYPYLPPLVYVFPPAAPPPPAAAYSLALARDHPFVDHRTGRVRRTLPYIDDWAVPSSTLAGLVRSLVSALRVCHPLTTSPSRSAAAAAASVEEEQERMRAALRDELASRLGGDMAAFRGRAGEEVRAMSAVQGRLQARAAAMAAAVRELEDERMRLEHAVTASLRHRGELLAWLLETSPSASTSTSTRCAPEHDDDDDAGAAALVAEGDAPRWIESKAAELAVDDTVDALGHALEKDNGGDLITFQEYIRRVKVLAREQFFHCHAASTSMSELELTK